MPTISRGFVDQAQLKEEVAQAAKALDPREVRDVQFRLGTDSGGEPAIFFGVLLTAHGSQEYQLAEVTGRVATTLFDVIQPTIDGDFNHISASPAISPITPTQTGCSRWLSPKIS